MEATAASVTAYTVDQVAAARKAMREALGFPATYLDEAAFVAELSDEVRELRTKGYTDEAIAELVAGATGVPLDAKTLAADYVDNRPVKHGD